MIAHAEYGTVEIILHRLYRTFAPDVCVQLRLHLIVDLRGVDGEGVDSGLRSQQFLHQYGLQSFGLGIGTRVTAFYVALFYIIFGHTQIRQQHHGTADYRHNLIGNVTLTRGPLVDLLRHSRTMTSTYRYGQYVSNEFHTLIISSLLFL